MQRRSRNGVPWAWARVAGLLAIATLAAVPSAHPAGRQTAGVPQRLVFGSVATRDPGQPMNLEFADPVSGATQLFATAPSKQAFTEATWSDDSETVAFVHFASSSLGDVPGRGINTKPTAGGPEVPILPASGAPSWISPFQPSWSPVKGEIAYWEEAPSSAPPYYGYTLKVATLPALTTRTLAGPFNPTGALVGVGTEQPAWSADGKRIAFARGRSGIVSLPATGGPLLQLVSGGAGYFVESPSYAPNGRDLAYVKYFENQGLITLWQLVVRDLRSGQERVIASGQQSFVFHGPQSWSPDSTQVAFTEAGHPATVNVVRRDGTGRRTLLQREGIDAPAWGGTPLPNYYIKDVEIAQAIAPELEPINDVDPLKDDPYELNWKLPSKNGYTMPLVAGKPTLVRIYVGDASMRPGTRARRRLSFRVEVSTGSRAWEGEKETIVTARDVEPLQTDEDGSLNVVLPALDALPAGTARVEVEINPGQEKNECEGCYPNGNRAHLDGVQFSQGGTLVLVPVPIKLFDTSTHPPKVYEPGPFSPYGMNQLIPAADGRIVLTQPRGLIEFTFPTNPLSRALSCSQLLNRVELFQMVEPDADLIGVSLGFGSAVEKWFGYARPPADSPLACGGMGRQAGCCFITTRSSSISWSAETAIHELGHTFGLVHKIGRKSSPNGAVLLPYTGIGGVGYRYTRASAAGLGQLNDIFTPEQTSDVMTYDDRVWTSPLTWGHMFKTIRDESGFALMRRPTSSQRDEALALRDDARPAVTRRLVSGAITEGDAVIFDSLVAKAVAPDSAGPLAGRIVALDSLGRSVATRPVRGKPYVLKGGATAVPFVVALPADGSIASLVLKGPAGKVLAERHRSATPPSGRFLDLPAQTRATTSLRVRWAATDADGNKMSVVLFAHRGQRPWRPVAMGLANSSAVVRPRSLGSNGPLQLRLLINDRFRTVLVDSAPIPVS